MAGGLALVFCALLPLCNVTRSDTQPPPAIVVTAPAAPVSIPAQPEAIEK